LKQLDQALAAYDKAVELNPNYRVTYYNKAGIYAKKNESTEACK
jgi:tetratricopeptide (TPR) repeat protein